MSLFNTLSADVTLHESCPCGAKLVVEGMSSMIEPYVHSFRVSHWSCTQALTKVQPCAHDFNLESTAPSCRLCGEPYRPPENTTIIHDNGHSVTPEQAAGLTGSSGMARAGEPISRFDGGWEQWESSDA